MNRKKVTAAALSVLMLAGLAACGGTGSSSPATTPQTTAASGEKQPAGTLKFSYTTDSGIEIAIGALSDPLVDQLGTPAKSFEAPSCAFSGTSYTYNYNDFTLETYPDNNVNKVYAVTLIGANAKTAEGLKIGDTAEDVQKVCGVPSKSSDAFLMYQSGDIALQFFTSNGNVTSIVYTMMV